MHANTQNLRRRRLPALGAALVALVLMLTGCGGDDAADETTTTTTEAPMTESVEITAVDYAFVGVPESVPAGTTLMLENTSTAEVHEIVAIRLPDDETRPVGELLQLPEEELATLFPFVETVVIAPPGEDGFPVEGTGTLTEPGRYALICAIPTGADPAEYLAAAAASEGGPPDVEGGPPHFVNGMYAELTVTG
jgi:hypothetical protein